MPLGIAYVLRQRLCCVDIAPEFQGTSPGGVGPLRILDIELGVVHSRSRDCEHDMRVLLQARGTCVPEIYRHARSKLATLCHSRQVEKIRKVEQPGDEMGEYE